NEAQQEFERILKRDQDLLPEQGAWFDTALKLLGTVGTVPVDSFREAIRDSATFQNDLTNFIRNVMFKERNLDRFEPLDDSGLNRELFESLGQALGMTPPLPTEQIHYRSSQYTPQEFLRDYLKINPSDFRTPFFTSRNLDSAIRQIQDAVQKGQAVPIALSLFEGSPANGVFSCTPTKPCQKIDGGHAMLIVKLHQDKTGQVDGFIVKNSWGDMGLNDRGRPTATESQRGFFLITRDYLVQSSRRGKFQLVLPAQP
ncbi:MAG: hypothetical protein ACXVBW_12035, partial [Bdellovibrionota bacterium]